MENAQAVSVILYILCAFCVLSISVIFLERLIDKEIKKMKAEKFKIIKLEVYKNKKKIS